MARRTAETFRCALGSVVARVDVPFGYSLTSWSVGALAIDRYGRPSTIEVFAFLIGGIVGYLVVAVTMAPVAVMIVPGRPRRASLFNVVAAVAAIAAATVTNLINDPLPGFFIAGFTGTLSYIIALATFDWLLAR